MCHTATLSSVSPRKTEILPLHLEAPHPPSPPLPPAAFDPPLQPRWKDDRLREKRVERKGGRRERHDSTSARVEHRGKRREAKSGKEARAILMMSLSLWEEAEEEAYAASKGAGAGLSMQTSLLKLTLFTLWASVGVTVKTQANKH